MVGGALGRLHLGGIGIREVAVEGVEGVGLVLREIRQLRQRKGHERQEIAHLHLHPVADQSPLRQVLRQRRRRRPVAAIDRTDGGEFIQSQIHAERFKRQK